MQIIGEAQGLNPTLALIIKGLIDISRIWINKIPNDYGRETLIDLSGALKRVVDAVSDSDPNDGEQIKRVIDELLTDTDFLDRTRLELLDKIDTIQDERLRGILAPALPVAFDIIVALFDEDPANEEQIKARLGELLRGAKSGEMLTNLLLFVVKDRATAATIANLILSIIGGVLKVEDLDA